jgi:hypothetical protein
MSQYRFGSKDKPHKFCPTCGTSMLIDFGESPHESENSRLAINVSFGRNGKYMVLIIECRQMLLLIFRVSGRTWN